jgi:hypothetical protein
LRNPIVCFGLLLKQTQAYIYIRLIASGIDKIHNSKLPKMSQRKTLSKIPVTPIFEKVKNEVVSPMSMRRHEIIQTGRKK